MAVTTTPRLIIQAAYGYSVKTRPAALADEETELLNLVHRAMQGLYAAAARVNPYFFADSAVVSFAGSGWARPEIAESVWRIEQTDGTEVVVVPMEDRGAEPESPSLVDFGKVYRPARAIAPDPQGGDLVFYYARGPVKAATLDTALDALWVEGHNALLVLETAIYLGVKGGWDVSGVVAGRDSALALFVAFLEHATANMVRRFGNINTFNKPSLVELKSLLAGSET